MRHLGVPCPASQQASDKRPAQTAADHHEISGHHRLLDPARIVAENQTVGLSHDHPAPLREREAHRNRLDHPGGELGPASCAVLLPRRLVTLSDGEREVAVDLEHPQQVGHCRVASQSVSFEVWLSEDQDILQPLLALLAGRQQNGESTSIDAEGADEVVQRGWHAGQGVCLPMCFRGLRAARSAKRILLDS
jgi:hypothetical protein